MKGSLRLVGLAVGVGLLTALPGAPAAQAAVCTRSWAAAVSGLWSDAGMWSPAGAPASTDDVCITLDGTYAVTVGSSPTVGSVTLGAPGNLGVQTLWMQSSLSATTNGLTIRPSGVLRMEAAGGATAIPLFVLGGTLSNAGTIDVNVGAGGGRQITANLTNQGAVNINSNINFDKVGGVITQAGGTFTVAPGRTLNVFASIDRWDQNGGTLAVAGTFHVASGIFNYNGGAIAGAGTLRLRDSALNLGPGGTGPATFTMAGTGSTLSGNVPAGQTIVVQGSSAGGGSAHLTAATGFTNAGTIRLESIDLNFPAVLVVTSGVLTNTGALEANPGAGGPRNINASLANQGTFNVNASVGLLKGSVTHTNTGTVAVAPAAALSFLASPQTFEQNAGTLNLAGTFTVNSGTFRFNGGSVTGGGTLSLSSATFFGAGTMAVNVANTGSQLNVGASPGVLNITGNYTQNATGALNVELAGPAAGTGFDRLNVTGSATLAGTLNVSRPGGFVPEPCQQFEFLTYGARTGDFATANGLGAVTGRTLRRIAGATGQTLVANTAGAKIDIHPTAVNVAEGGATAAYNACLGSAPAATVTVNAGPDSQVTASPSSLSFTTATWPQVQGVTATAVDDAVFEGAHTGTIAHTSASADPGFNGLALPSVVASIADNDVLVAAVMNVQESIAVADSPTALPPALVDVAETIQGGDAAAFAAVIAIQENVGVADGPSVIPPALLDVAETVQVGDAPSFAAIIAIQESVGVADGPSVIPPALLDVAETVQVGDAPSLAAIIAIQENVGVADGPSVIPPALLDVAEAVLVGDGPTVLPPALVDVAEVVGVGDAPSFAPTVFVQESVGVSDGPAVIPPAVVDVGEAVAVSEQLATELHSDPDGVSDAVEAAAPNNGDGNGDGAPDSQQANVTSLPATTGQYVTLASSAGTELADVQSIPNPAPATAPAGVTFPVGFFEYSVTGLPPGGAVIVTLYLPPGVTVNSYWKYGPAPGNPAPHWYSFLWDGQTGAIIRPGFIRLRFVDGQRGDHDLAANGTISDPGTPGLEPTLETTTHFAATPNPTLLGEDLLLVATVESLAGTPVGDVTFMDGASILGEVPLDGTGKATLVASSLGAGSHSLVARYLGNETFNGSASQPVLVRVLYRFGGFRQPVVAPVQTFKLGSTIPVKLRLFDAGGSPVAGAIAHLDIFEQDDGVPDLEPEDLPDLLPDSGGDTFRYDATEQQYIFNLGTRGMAGPGRYRLFADLDDGTVHEVDIFLK